jgi:glycosyltransferase involved in cell wall biosynthesis
MPVIFYAIGSDVMKADSSTVYFAVFKKIIFRSDCIICVNSTIKKKLLGFGYNPSKIKIIPSIVAMPELPDFSPPKEYTIITIGSIDANKNHILLLQACKLLPKVSAIIVGDGPLRDKIQQESLSLVQNVSFTGNLPHNEVLMALKKSSIYVHTAKREGLPAAVLEAMLCGLPVILLKSDYIVDITQRYGLVVHIVESASGDDLANKIQEVLSNFDKELSIADRNRCVVRSLAKMAEKDITNIINSFCNQAVMDNPQVMSGYVKIN